MLAADPPPVVATVPVDKPADVVVVSRDAHSEILASRDTPLPLIKGRRTEDAVLRQVIFLTSTLTVVRPAAGAGEQTLRWTYEPYLQRQLCFTSITGQFSCALAEVEELPEKATGEALLAPASAQAASAQAAPDQAAPAPNPAAEGVRTDIAATLRTRSDALFDDDRRLKLDPILKAAGVSIRRISVSAGPDSRRSASQPH
jgi:hypothetical protein